MQSALDMKSQYDKVVLVSKDLNLRLLSQGEGLAAEDYENDKISIKTVHTGFRHIGENPIFPSIYNPELDIPTHEFIEDPTPNGFISDARRKKVVIQNVDGNLRPVLKNWHHSPQKHWTTYGHGIASFEDVKLVSPSARLVRKRSSRLQVPLHNLTNRTSKSSSPNRL